MFWRINQAGPVVVRRQTQRVMKQLNLSLPFLFTLLLGVVTPFEAQAERPNPPGIAGSAPVAILVTEPGSTNLVAVPPRVHVINEHGRVVADIETTVQGLTGVFDIKLKKAGTYVIWAYYPAPNQLNSSPQLVDVFRKETSTVNLAWQPQ